MSRDKKLTEKKFILALDAGTTSSRAILFDRRGDIKGVAQQEFPQIYPKPGWVEHDPDDLWNSQIGVAREVLEKSGVEAAEIAAAGITNQRETTLVWDRNTGLPVCNAIVWQDRRTAPICEELKDAPAPAGRAGTLADYIQETTGLVIDAYFSATKIAWILRNGGYRSGSSLQAAAERGALLFGTVDTWLLWGLTGGKVHATDVTNASRTMLYNIKTLKWDRNLLEALDIPASMLPEVKPSGHVYGDVDEEILGTAGLPIAGIAGDQQAALFGQACFEPGTVKSTYGTGSFILMNTGSEPVASKSGLLSTIAWGIDDTVEYALEGSVFVTGAAVQWLRDEMGLIRTAAESEACARQVEDTGGVYMVPAFTGLGAPYWDMYARGTIVGITRGTTRNHIIRAVLESLAYQVRDVVEAMSRDSGIEMKELRVDGGASANDFLMQFQADVLGVPVIRPAVVESTARGAAFLAGLTVGFWRDRRAAAAVCTADRRFVPEMEERQRELGYAGWKRAVVRARAWEANKNE
jgi:glycerol kinase